MTSPSPNWNEVGPELLKAAKELKDIVRSFIGALDADEVEVFEMAIEAIAKAEART